MSPPGWAKYKKLITDCLIQAEVYLPKGEKWKLYMLLDVPKMNNDNVVGTYCHNPILISVTYDLEFLDER